MPGPDPPLLFHGHAIEAALCDLGGENVAADMGDMGYDRSAFGIKQARDDTGHRLAEGDAQQVGGGDIGPDDSDDLVARQVRQAGMIARQLRIKLRFVGTLIRIERNDIVWPEISQHEFSRAISQCITSPGRSIRELPGIPNASQDITGDETLPKVPAALAEITDRTYGFWHDQ